MSFFYSLDLQLRPKLQLGPVRRSVDLECPLYIHLNRSREQRIMTQVKSPRKEKEMKNKLRH